MLVCNALTMLTLASAYSFNIEASLRKVAPYYYDAWRQQWAWWCAGEWWVYTEALRKTAFYTHAKILLGVWDAADECG